MQQADLIVHNIGELVTVAGGNEPRIGEQMKDLEIVTDGAVAVKDGKICETGAGKEILQKSCAVEFMSTTRSCESKTINPTLMCSVADSRLTGTTSNRPNRVIPTTRAKPDMANDNEVKSIP